MSCWQISPQGAQVLWQLPLKYTTFQCSSACIHAGRVYAHCGVNDADGHFYIAVDLESGKVLAETSSVGKNLSASIVAIGDMILDVNAQRHFRADPALLAKGLVETWTRDGYERIPTPAIVGTRIFIRDNEGIRCYELAARR
jgi:hypothetical protein